MMQIVRKELEIFGSWTCVFSIEETMKLMQVQRLDINSIITHRYKFEDGKKAFEDALTDKEGRIKSIIEIF